MARKMIIIAIHNKEMTPDEKEELRKHLWDYFGDVSIDDINITHGGI